MALTPFGKAVRKARLDADVTLGEMAAELGVTSAFLSSIENGRKKVPQDLVPEVQKFLEKRHIAAPSLQSLADVSNESVSLEGLSPEHQMIVAGLARASWNNINAEELENLRSILQKMGAT